MPFSISPFNNCVDCEHTYTVVNESNIVSFDQNRLFVCGSSDGPCPQIGPTSARQFIPVPKSTPRPHSPASVPTTINTHDIHAPLSKHNKMCADRNMHISSHP